ncbi:MAG TPA: protein-glutamate O-methyltransferase CheR [Peptococcaceae bacterium]|jgi:chemotaxis protein methyltransferase CheR|nr:protein-glutamate O-methyltransferase CheR [Clostridia bacterium]HOB82470.1 protein-glutamate O-methyltransferase CheR [Peptococcaceae bacterium]HPZ71914.1 protein-glutamate O-methyltransferase CheR [Peptococcaceae bacterium]HQD53542.1 protein-glutamate O-methyltransferase CheR [Peptococcaceae bacterium]
MIRIKEKEFNELSEYIHRNLGIKLGKEKKTLLIGRLQNVLLQKNLRSFSEYYDYLRNEKTGEAVATLVEKITTNHTFFMREAEHFAYFRDVVLPYLADTVKSKDLRIWSAGCSTGEEAYTLAMIMQDYFGFDSSWDKTILATDISGKVLEIARKGEYYNRDLGNLPVQWRVNYFKRLNPEKSVIVDTIKNQVLFRSFNLMNPTFPFKKKFHVIFCRNVMIYFDAPTKDGLVNRFYDVMEDGGYLFIGHSESLNREKVKFKYIMPAIYRKE